MKVDVIQAKDIEFGKFRWWSNWIDITVFSFGGYGYLLQMRVSRTNSKKFKCVPFKSLINVARARVEVIGDLVQMSRGDNE